jgi:outer membrane lipopolysaccharide assembly protein LptE/RlpB
MLAIVLATGCGYSLVGAGGSLGDVHTIAIPALRNDSWEPGAEYVVGDALRREFLRRQGVRLVEDTSRADLVLDGRVRTVRSRAATVDSLVLALEYEVTIELDLEARRADGRKVPLDRESLRDSERYLASADQEATRKNRTEALRRVASVLAGRAYTALAETLEQQAEAAPEAPPEAERPGGEEPAAEGDAVGAGAP